MQKLTTKISVKLEPDQLYDLQEVAESQGLTVSRCVRKAVVSYIREHNEEGGSSILRLTLTRLEKEAAQKSLRAREKKCDEEAKALNREIGSLEGQRSSRFREQVIETNHHSNLGYADIDDGEWQITGCEMDLLFVEQVNLAIAGEKAIWPDEDGRVVDILAINLR